jgi:ABC-2 type transport system ATP-binding protein
MSMQTGDLDLPPGRAGLEIFVRRWSPGLAMLRPAFMNPEPMIEVSHLTKRYAAHTAVDDITFTVGRGEIVGLLGPNGAGKSTTMRILSCFMPASSGMVRVAGLDVFRDSLEVRRRIGFMPENNPLHLEMRVREYLKFRARIKGLSRARSRDRADMVLDQCGLTGVTDRIIGTLSKGYRQRVGIADALIHEPELIILDEPTIGLDPHQIRSVRELIKGLAQKHTVLISTHILPEVEMTCSRVLIMFEGRILAADSTENLHHRMSSSSQVIAEIAAPQARLHELLSRIPEIETFDITHVDGAFLRCALTPGVEVDLRPALFQLARENGWPLRELTRSRHSLEDIYIQITQPDEEADI